MCTKLATAGLGYDITGSRAWLYDLDTATIAGSTRQREAVVPLCSAHADRITVPVGWEFEDRRAPAPEPTAAVPGTAAEIGPLFTPRSRPEPAHFAEPVESAEAAEPVESTEPAEFSPSGQTALREPPQPSLLERAFRASPTRSQ